MYETPASADDIENGNYPSMDAPFKSSECGQRGSQLEIIDNVVKNVTDTIEKGWNTFTETITNIATNNLNLERSKRQAEQGEPDKDDDLEDNTDDDSYACVKVVLGRTAYRSCVPKYGEIRLNCTSMVGKNVVCYCHEDDCNQGQSLRPFSWGAFFGLTLTSLYLVL